MQFCSGYKIGKVPGVSWSVKEIQLTARNRCWFSCVGSVFDDDMCGICTHNLVASENGRQQAVLHRQIT